MKSMAGREQNKRFFVTVENRDPQLPPSEALTSEYMPDRINTDTDLVKHLYKQHKDVLPDKLTVQLTGNFKVVFQAIIKPSKKRNRLTSLTGTVFKNKTEYYLGLSKELNEGGDFRIKI